MNMDEQDLALREYRWRQRRIWFQAALLAIAATAVSVGLAHMLDIRGGWPWALVSTATLVVTIAIHLRLTTWRHARWDAQSGATS